MKRFQPLPLGPVYASEADGVDAVKEYVASDSIEVHAAAALTQDFDVMGDVGVTSDYHDALADDGAAALAEIIGELGVPQSEFSELLV